MPQPLPSKIQKRLKEFPFMRTAANMRKRMPRDELDPCSRCRSIQSKLRSEMALDETDLQFTENHRAEAQRLKRHIEPHFWLEYQSLADTR